MNTLLWKIRETFHHYLGWSSSFPDFYVVLDFPYPILEDGGAGWLISTVVNRVKLETLRNV